MTAQDQPRHVVRVPYWAYDTIEDYGSRVTWITGGLGSGKTTGGALWFVHRWLLNRDSSFSWAVAPTYTKVEQILIPALRDVLRDVYGYQQDKHYTITKSPFWKIRLKDYRHELHLLSGDRPQHFVGSNIACWWITEPGLQSKEVYEKIQNRLRCPKAVIRQGLAEGTPEGMNWYADFADIPGVGYTRRNDKKHTRRIVETTFNKYLKPSPEEYAQTQIRDVYAYDKNKILSYEKGLFVPFTKSTAYWEWYESRNVDREGMEPSPHLPISLTFDFNVTPLAWVAIQERTIQRRYDAPREHRYYVLRESSGESRGLMDGVAEFAAEFPVHQYGHTAINVYGDASGWARNLHTASSSYTEIENYLRALGYRNVNLLAFRANPSIKDRLEKVAALMAYERVFVSPRCTRLIQSFGKTTLKEGTYEIEKKKGEDHTHFGDAAGYALFQLAKDIDLARPQARRAYGA